MLAVKRAKPTNGTADGRPRTKRLSTAVPIIALGIIGAFSFQAQATVVVDPNGIGANNVFPNNLETNPNTDSIFIGFNGFGEVEVNASSDGNGFTSISATTSFQVGSSTTGGSGPGTLRVIGNGSAGSASAFGSPTGNLAVGIGGDGLIEVLNGGLVSSGSIQIGASTSDADIVVDGSTSRLEATSGSISFSDVAEGVQRSLTVRNGATASASGGQFGSDMDVQDGDQLTVTGAGSNAEFEGRMTVRGQVDVLDSGRIDQVERIGVDNPKSLTVGSLDGSSSVRVSDAGSEISLLRDVEIGASEELTDIVVDPDTGDFNFIFEPTGGSLIVENDGTFRTAEDIRVASNDNQSTGVVTVRSGGNLFANELTLSEGGTLNGGDGFITANVILDGGTIAPGNSPGTMFIDGDLILNSGLLEIELESPTETDFFDVTGDVLFGDDLMVDLILSFLPTDVIDIADFFNFDSFGIDPAFSLLSNVNLVFSPDVVITDGDIVTVALFDSVQDFPVGDAAAVPGPGVLALLVLGLGGLGFVRRRQTT